MVGEQVGGMHDVLGLGAAASAVADEVNQVLDSFDRPFYSKTETWTDPDGTLHVEKRQYSLLTVLGILGVFIVIMRGAKGFPMLESLLAGAGDRMALFAGSGGDQGSSPKQAAKSEALATIFKLAPFIGPIGAAGAGMSQFAGTQAGKKVSKATQKVLDALGIK